MEEARVGVLQVPSGDKELFAGLLEAVSEDTRLIVAPEYLNALPRSERTSAAEWVDLLESAAIEHGVSILAGLLVEEGGCRYSAVVHARPRGGVEIVYRKILVYPGRGAESEERVICRGREPPPVLDLGCCRVATILCYELRFPELARYAMLSGAEVLAVLAAWHPGPLKEDILVVLARARAIENAMFVIVANQPAPVFTGRSMVVSPLGYRLAAAGPGPAYIEAVLRPEELREARESLPLERDARLALEVLTSYMRRGS